MKPQDKAVWSTFQVPDGRDDPFHRASKDTVSLHNVTVPHNVCEQPERCSELGTAKHRFNGTVDAPVIQGRVDGFPIKPFVESPLDHQLLGRREIPLAELLPTRRRRNPGDNRVGDMNTLGTIDTYCVHQTSISLSLQHVVARAPSRVKAMRRNKHIGPDTPVDVEADALRDITVRQRGLIVLLLLRIVPSDFSRLEIPEDRTPRVGAI